MWTMPRGLAMAGILVSLLGIGSAAWILEAEAERRVAAPRPGAPVSRADCRPFEGASPASQAVPLAARAGQPWPPAFGHYRLRCLTQ